MVTARKFSRKQRLRGIATRFEPYPSRVAGTTENLWVRKQKGYKLSGKWTGHPLIENFQSVLFRQPWFDPADISGLSSIKAKCVGKTEKSRWTIDERHAPWKLEMVQPISNGIACYHLSVFDTSRFIYGNPDFIWTYFIICLSMEQFILFVYDSWKNSWNLFEKIM